MKKKMIYLMKMSLNKKIKTKWFIIANLALLLIIVGMVNIDSIIKFFGGDFDDMTQVLVIDNTNYGLYDNLVSTYDKASVYLEDMRGSSIIQYDKDIATAKDEVKEDDNKVILLIENDPTNFMRANLISNNDVDAIILQLINASLNDVKQNIALSHYDITEDKLAVIEAPVTLEKEKLNTDSTDDETMDLIMGVIFPIIFLPFFLLTMFLIQMIGAEINEEKTTKGMEIIISNVSPKAHLMSKVLASNIFVFLQGFILIIDAVIAIIVRAICGMGDIESLLTNIDLGSLTANLASSGVMDRLGYVIPITLCLMVITFIAYSLVAGILASMTTNTEDFQQLQTPIVIVSLIGYYLAMLASIFNGSLFIKVLSYVPFLSALLSPALLVMGQVSIIDVLISFVLLIGTIYLLFKYGLRIYKVGILNYSGSGLWKKMARAVKNK